MSDDDYFPLDGGFSASDWVKGDKNDFSESTPSRVTSFGSVNRGLIPTNQCYTDGTVTYLDISASSRSTDPTDTSKTF